MEIFNYFLAIVIGYFTAVSPMVKIVDYIQVGIKSCNLLLKNPIFDDVTKRLIVLLRRKYCFSLVYQIMIVTYVTMVVYGFLHLIVFVYLVSTVLTYCIFSQRKSEIEEGLRELEAGVEISKEESFYEYN